MSLLVLSAPRLTFAHDTGASTSDAETLADGSVTVSIHLPHGDARRLLGGDRNGDGHLDEAELLADPRTLERFAREGLEVRAGGELCPPRPPGGRATSDGIFVEARFSCAAPPSGGAGTMTLTFDFLGELGPEHRHFAVARRGTTVRQAVLTPASRTISWGEAASQGSPGDPRLPAEIPRNPGRKLAIGAAAVGVTGAWVAFRRRRRVTVGARAHRGP